MNGGPVGTFKPLRVFGLNHRRFRRRGSIVLQHDLNLFRKKGHLNPKPHRGQRRVIPGLTTGPSNSVSKKGGLNSLLHSGRINCTPRTGHKSAHKPTVHSRAMHDLCIQLNGLVLANQVAKRLNPYDLVSPPLIRWVRLPGPSRCCDWAQSCKAQLVFRHRGGNLLFAPRINDFNCQNTENILSELQNLVKTRE